MWAISCTEYYLYANGHTYKALLSINYKMVVGFFLSLICSWLWLGLHQNIASPLDGFLMTYNVLYRVVYIQKF
jgi:hypothetical protein